MQPDQPKAQPVSPAIPLAVLRPAIVYAILFGAQGAYLPYISIYLASTGLDLGTVGVLIALFAAVSVVAAPWWGALADSSGDIRGPVVVAGLLSGVAVLALALAAGPVLIALATIFLAAAWAGVIPMIDSRTVRMVGHRDRFGQARAPGSGAFVVVAFATSAVVAATGPGGMFLVYGPLVVLTGLSAWLLLRLPAAPPATDRADRDRARSGSGRGRSGISPARILGVLRTPRLGIFFIASIAVWTSHSALLGFISLRIIELGGSSTLVAVTWSLGAAIEVPLMYAFPALARRFGVERLLVVGAFAFAGRAVVGAFVADPGMIALSSLFGGVGFAFFYIGTVSWVSSSVGRGVQATAQGVFTGTAQSIGAICGSIIGGAIGAQFGLPVLFGLSGLGYAIGGTLVWIGLFRGPSVERGPAPGSLG
ncbi:MAG: MFS transporter [Chloroflexi bacterium]|nr:MFS transporter [Chloroflexota bacterium]